MDATEESLTSKEMLERIAELDYSQSQLRDQNAEMRHLLDVADDEVAVLRSENVSLGKQVKALQKIVSEAQQFEAEPCGSILADDPNIERCSEKKIQKLEKESTWMKEQNEKLTTELRSLQQERDRDKISLSKYTVALQTLEWGIEAAQLGLQHRDEVIHQQSLQLKHLEDTLEDCSNIIKDLRLTNQELRKQLEDSQDEASFAVLNDVMREKERSLSPPLSFAEEIQLLASSAEVKTSMSTDLRPEEVDADELLEPQQHLQTQRRAGILETAVRRAGMFLLFVFMLTVLAFVASGGCAGNSDFFSINTLWSGARLMLQPYCRVHYGALPPI